MISSRKTNQNNVKSFVQRHICVTVINSFEEEKTGTRRFGDKLFANRRHSESCRRIIPATTTTTTASLLVSFITHWYKNDKQKALPCRMHTQFHTWSVQCFKACRDTREKTFTKHPGESRPSTAPLKQI